jgi:ribokinase
LTVVVVGSINIDLSMYLDRWPLVGETLTARDSAVALGGKGANQCVAAARLGAQTTFIGAIGDDLYGREAVAGLNAENITLHLRTVKGMPTGIACIDVGPNGDNIIRLATGANGALRPTDITAQSAAFRGANAVLLQNEIPLDASVAAAQCGRAAGAVVLMDPAPVPDPTWPHETYAHFDILTPNASEAGRILGRVIDGPEAAAAAACDLAGLCRRGAIVTLGAQGVAWFVDGRPGHIAAVPVKAVDTVAAGDCFNGALAAQLAVKSDIRSAIEFATQAAALSASKQGAQVSLPTFEQVEDCAAKNLAERADRTV